MRALDIETKTYRLVYGKLGIKMCYPIEPRQNKLTAQILQTGTTPPICYIHC